MEQHHMHMTAMHLALCNAIQDVEGCCVCCLNGIHLPLPSTMGVTLWEISFLMR